MRQALARLVEDDHPDPDAKEVAHEQEEAALEPPVQRTIRNAASRTLAPP